LYVAEGRGNPPAQESAGLLAQGISHPQPIAQLLKVMWHQDALLLGSPIHASNSVWQPFQHDKQPFAEALEANAKPKPKAQTAAKMSFDVLSMIFS
jgi:hypothetical protein